jgi:hypothetical protein
MSSLMLVLAALALLPSSVDDPPPKYTPATRDYGTVHAAWEYQGPWPVAVPRDLKLVAADIALPAPPEGERFDLDDIDIFDADSGENFGSDPSIQRLTADGRFVADDDPDVKDRRDYRGLFVWTVKRGVKRVSFGYWGGMLFVRPVPLAPSGRLLPPAPALEVAGVGALGPAEGYERHGALLHARNWSRARAPGHYGLVVRRQGVEDEICDWDAWLEVDAAGRPFERPAAGRPYYEKDRWFLVDFWCPAGARPVALNRFGDRTPLPKAALPPLSPETLKRLPGSNRNDLASHRPKPKT